MNKLFLLLLAFLLLGYSFCEAQEDRNQAEVFYNAGTHGVSGITDAQPIFNSDWQWLHPTPAGNNLRYVKVWDADNWYALGYSGTFLKTSDGGSSWYLNKNIGGVDPDFGYGHNLFGGFFFDMSNGLACGEDGTLVKTTDGGDTWFSVYNATTGFIYDIYFISPTLGFACGLVNVGLLKTTDAGDTWTQVPGTLPDNAYSVYAFDENNILLGSANGNILRTTDGGSTWATVYAAGSSLIWSIDFIDANNGMASGIDAALAATTDGGATWTVRNSGIPPTSDFLNIRYRAGAFYATGDNYNMYYTTDMGVTWNSFGYLDPDQSYTSSFYAADFIDDNHVVTVGAVGMINETTISPLSTTAHNTWIKASTLYDDWAESSTGRVIAVGAPGIPGVTFDQAMYSNDGGETWAVSQTDSSLVDYNALSMATPLIGYAACVDDYVYKTTDGGESWTQTTRPVVGTSDLETISFVNENTGYTFGEGGLGYKTTDGGSTWSPLTTGVSAGLYGSFFLDENTGYVCGGSGTILKTTDGGASFTPQPSGATSSFYAVYMVNENVVYACGSSSKVRKTTDGGTTWTNEDVTVSVSLNDIQFGDENHGIAVGSYGSTFTTTDGGTTWSYENVGSGTLYSVYIEKVSTGTASVYACGSLGHILKNPNLVVPVELVSFNASISGTDVNLTWKTATETNNKGFQIERKSGSGKYENVSFINGNGTTTAPQQYSYTDKDLSAGSYTYRLKQVDFDGSYYYSSEVEVDLNSPAEFAMEQNYPNPFNPSTTIEYSIPQDGFVALKIYNSLGQEVSRLVNNFVKAGNHSVTFNASSLASGIYYYKIEAGSNVKVRKMMLLK